MTLSILTLRTNGLFATLGINDTQHKRHSAKDTAKMTLSIRVSSFIMLSVAFFIVMLSVVLLSVVAPNNRGNRKFLLL